MLTAVIGDDVYCLQWLHWLNSQLGEESPIHWLQSGHNIGQATKAAEHFIHQWKH